MDLSKMSQIYRNEIPSLALQRNGRRATICTVEGNHSPFGAHGLAGGLRARRPRLIYGGVDSSTPPINRLLPYQSFQPPYGIPPLGLSRPKLTYGGVRNVYATIDRVTVFMSCTAP